MLTGTDAERVQRQILLVVGRLLRRELVAERGIDIDEVIAAERLRLEVAEDRAHRVVHVRGMRRLREVGDLPPRVLHLLRLDVATELEELPFRSLPTKLREETAADLEEAARLVRGRRVASHVKALVVPGSQAVRRAAEAKGLHEVFTKAGFEWRGAGCSMCLAMNPDKLEGRQVCASSSNRNFKGRQGSPTGRTLLMSPAMVAAAAIAGQVTDVRRVQGPGSNVQGSSGERS